MTAVHDLQPVKASLVVDLVGLININLADLLQVKARACPDCGGSGVVVILLNYLSLLGGSASNVYLFVGLGLIVAGFITSTRWH